MATVITYTAAMFKSAILSVLFTFPLLAAFPQSVHVDSLNTILLSAPNDTIRLNTVTALVVVYGEEKPDSAFYYSQELLRIAQKLKLPLNEVHAYIGMAYALLNKGDYPASLKLLFMAESIANDPASEQVMGSSKFLVNEKFYDHPMTPHFERINSLANVYLTMGILYGNNNDLVNELSYKLKSKELTTECKNIRMLSTINLLLIRTYLADQKIDTALEVGQTAYRQAIQSGFDKYLGSILLNLGRIYSVKGEEGLAAEYVRKAISCKQGKLYTRCCCR